MIPLISLIIPVYNGEHTLAVTLNSVKKQSFHDFECLLVNDGSTDGSADILKLFTESDSRFCVVNISNGGVSHAKNVAMKHARGKYLAFLDCDDVLEPHALETLFDIITRTNADLAVAHVIIENSMGIPLANSPELPVLSERQLIMTASQTVDIIFQGQPFGGYLHGKLIRADSISGLFYRENIYIYEDMLFLMEMLTRCQTIVYSPVIVHHYVVAHGALSATVSIRKTSSLLACEEMKILAQKYFPNSVNDAMKFAFINALWVLEEIASSPAQVRKSNWAKEARMQARKTILVQPFPSHLTIAQKVRCYAVRLCWPAFLFIHLVLFERLKKLR